MSARRTSYLIFYAAFAALMLALHLPYLRLPLFWDELGTTVPAALRLYGNGTWAAPYGLTGLLALTWNITGYSIAMSRMLMLGIASLGVFFVFLLAIRLARGTVGAPAFAAALFLLATPAFYMQSMLITPVIPAMALTALALLLFLGDRFLPAAAVCVLLVMFDGTAVSTPLVLGLWLLRKPEQRRVALAFLPAVGLAMWTHGGIALHPEIALAALWQFFAADGKVLGSIALFVGWRLVRGADWNVALSVGAAQFALLAMSGALEHEYLVVLPLVYIAMAVAASGYTPHWRWASHTMMTAALVLGWFWNAPYPAPLENNLAMINFVRLQEEASSFLEAYAPGRRIATAWPLTDALRNPEAGYVRKPLRTVELRGLDLASIADAHRDSYDAVVLFSRTPPTLLDSLGIDLLWMRQARRRLALLPEASSDQMRNALDLEPVMHWERQGLWITLYARER